MNTITVRVPCRPRSGADAEIIIQTLMQAGAEMAVHSPVTALLGDAKKIDHYVRKIKVGKITPEGAGKKLAKPCPCGIFNVPRTIEVLRGMATK